MTFSFDEELLLIETESDGRRCPSSHPPVLPLIKYK